ncbi:DUF4153 domain-containing protein [Nocardia sp. NPDC060256]|uniref:DUF4153 domain-containing protein n=1 Tax=unclassified Nocardia TaxID=2637762 RepID=UPI00365090B3
MPETPTSPEPDRLEVPVPTEPASGRAVPEGALLSVAPRTAVQPDDETLPSWASMQSYPGPPYQPMPRWARVVCPPGVLPAACLAGFTGAALIPVDRPGIGWLLTGSVAVGALYLVDRNARKSAQHNNEVPDVIDWSAPSETTAPDPAHGASPTPPAATSNPGGEDSTSSTKAVHDTDFREKESAVANTQHGKFGNAQDSTAASQRDEENPKPAAGAKPQPKGTGAKPDSISDGSSAGGLTQSGDHSAATDEEPSRDRTVAAVVPADSVTRAATGAKSEAGAVDATATSAEVGRASSATGRDQSPDSFAESPAGDETLEQSTDRGVLGATSARIWWAGMFLALLAVGTFRAAGWLFTLCVLAACVAGSLAVVGRRSTHGVLYDVIAWPLAALVALPWVYTSAERLRGIRSQREWGIALSVVVTIALLAVFVPLLGGADATFANLLESVTPEVDSALTVQWILLFVVVGLAALGALYVLAAPPLPASEFVEEEHGRTLRRLEWALPVGALTVLFAVFVGAQFVALFGGDDYVQRTAGLTYAEYARSGFWQLSAVTILTLAVILVVLRWAATDSAADRLWLRVLLCAVSVLSLIIVASALARMWTYQQAYGFTVLRLLVEVCELWLGLVYLLVLASVLSLRRMWLSRAMIGTAMTTLLALAILNPERLVADKNIDRWQHGEAFDAEYLATLSTDILPATDRLSEPLRTEVRTRIRDHLDPDTWHSWNLSRANAAN